MDRQTVHLDGVDVPLWERGDGPPLLWLHGWSSQVDETAFLDRLARHHRVLAPQHPGFGETGRPGWVRTMEDMALYYRLLLRTVAPGRTVVLAGHDLGGWIAAEFAVRFSHLLDALVLVAPLGLRLAERPVADLFMLSAEEFHALAWQRPDAVTPVDTGSLSHVRDREMTAQLAWEPRLFAPRLHERLRFVDVPAVVTWGAADRVADPRHADLWCGHLPDARGALVPGTGHHPHVEAPSACADLVLAGLAGAAASGG